MGGEATTGPPEELRTMASMTESKEMTSENQGVDVRQLAELAAAAAHRKSLDEDRVLSRGPSRKQLTRRGSSGVSRNGSSAGLRAMSRSFGSERLISRTNSMQTPRSRGVHRSSSSDVSPMHSRSYARNHHRDTESHGSDARNVPERGVRRAQSSVAESSFPRRGPDKRSLIRSDSARAVPSRRGVGRTCSQNSLNHMSQNGAKASSAEVGTLRPYRGRDGLVNTSIQRSDSMTSRSQQLNLLRRSFDDRSEGEQSNLTMATMDSVNLRKQQIVADPIDDAATYRDADSYADHESESMATNDVYAPYAEFVPERNPNHVPYDGVSVVDGGSVVDAVPAPSQQRIVGGTKSLDDTNHSHPNQIACDMVSLSTIGGEIDESSYLGEYEYESMLREEIDAFDEDDDPTILEGVSEED